MCEQANREEYKHHSPTRIETLENEKKSLLNELKSKILKTETPQTPTPQNKF